MSTETKVGIVAFVAMLLGSFAAGRYSVSAPHTIASSQTNADTQTQDNKNTHTQTTITETKKPDGTTVITTHIDTKATDTKNTEKEVETQTKTEVVPQKTNTLNLSLMGGYDMIQEKPVYGLSITKQLMGPITMGLFGLTNGTVGATIGLNF